MKKINLDEILLIHEQMIDTFGGTNGLEIKDYLNLQFKAHITLTVESISLIL